MMRRLLLPGVFAALAIASPAPAATFLVTTTADSGPGSLRQAVADANASAGPDAIAFSGLAWPATISLVAPRMDVVGELTIEGPGPGLLTIEGDGTITGLFRLNRSADVQNRLVLRGATVRSFRYLYGGAIEGYGATGPEPLESVIEVDGCVFEENGWASGDPNAQGGAIYASGSLTIRRSEFVGNTTGGNGGGAIQSSGPLLIEDSLFWGNSAESDGGGAIRILGSGAVTRRIANSTFSDNHVTVDSANNDGGGAIAFVGLGAGTGLQVYNCTFAGNSTVQGGGGAIFFASSAAPSFSSLTISSSVFAANTSAGSPNDLSPEPEASVTADYSLFQGHASAAAAGIDSTVSSLFGVDPLLGSIVDNGGPTRTRRPGSGSPAIDAGTNALGLSWDQRGEGFPRVVGSAADIGAHETGTTDLYALTVLRTGPGAGAVASADFGIACGSECTDVYGAGAVVSLTALPEAGSVFAGWSGGGCSGTGACAVTMNATQSVTARFEIAPAPGGETLTVSVVGNGTVTSLPAGIDCAPTCSFSFAAGAQVTLSPSPAPDWAGTTGDPCVPGAASCTVTMAGARNVTFYFLDTAAAPVALTVTRSGSGTGTVASDLPGIACGVDCAESYTRNSLVTLTAAPQSGSTFAGWSGGPCSGTAPTCVVPMTQARAVDAAFTLREPASVPGLGALGSFLLASLLAGVGALAIRLR